MSECEEKGDSNLPWIQYKEKCYYVTPDVIDQRQSWASAESFCKQNGGFLVSIHTINELNFITSRVT